MLAQDAELAAEDLLASGTAVARAAGDAGIDHHAVARPDVSLPRSRPRAPCRRHRCRRCAGNGGTWQARRTVRHPEIEMVQSRGVDADPDLGGSAKHWWRHIDHGEVSGRAGGGQAERAHSCELTPCRSERVTRHIIAIRIARHRAVRRSSLPTLFTLRIRRAPMVMSEGSFDFQYGSLEAGAAAPAPTPRFEVPEPAPGAVSSKPRKKAVKKAPAPKPAAKAARPRRPRPQEGRAEEGARRRPPRRRRPRRRRGSPPRSRRSRPGRPRRPPGRHPGKRHRNGAARRARRGRSGGDGTALPRDAPRFFRGALCFWRYRAAGRGLRPGTRGRHEGADWCHRHRRGLGPRRRGRGDPRARRACGGGGWR